VVVGRPARHRRLRVSNQPETLAVFTAARDDLRRARRRRRTDPRITSEPQTELELVPRVRVLPAREFIGPRRVVLGTAERVRLVGAVRRRHRAVLPRPPALTRLVVRAGAPGGAGEEPALALDDDVPDFGRRSRHERDALVAPRHAVADPLGPRPRLAEPSAGQKEAHEPVALGLELIRSGPELPDVLELDEVSA